MKNVSGTASNGMSVAVLYFLSFVTNAAILVLEIAGGRLLAPYIGTSVGVWAGLIAVILGGMALGYRVGGHLGDRDASQKRIGLVITVAGMAALISWGMRDFIPTLFGN
ncbi:MAG: fused MFS/spermidine synthase, partial [Patescibacteria group bacterium]